MVFFFIKHEEVLCQKHLLINTSDFTLDTLDLDIKFFLILPAKMALAILRNYYRSSNI